MWILQAFRQCVVPNSRPIFLGHHGQQQVAGKEPGVQ